MAYAYRLGGPAQAVIRLSRADLAAPKLLAALVLGNKAYPLSHCRLEGDLLHVEDHTCQLERILQQGRNIPVGVLLRDTDGGKPDHLEPLLFHHSFFAPFFDFARSAPWSEPRPKPELLAVFTHAHDDNEMLRYWQAHFLRLVQPRHLYVIDHGSAVSPRAVLHSEANVVRLPRGETDHADMARFCGNFQRFLLSQYRWVLHTDADELLVDEQGEDALRAKLAGGERRGVLVPQHAADVLHNVRTEKPLRPDEPLSAQRGLLLPAPALFKKPVLASIPASWLQGFHQVYETPALREEPGLWLLHLHAADARLLREKNRRWNARRQSPSDLKVNPQHNRPEDAAALGRWFAEKLADERLMALPEGLKGRF